MTDRLFTIAHKRWLEGQRTSYLEHKRATSVEILKSVESEYHRQRIQAIDEILDARASNLSLYLTA